jgi:hypothetical protein
MRGGNLPRGNMTIPAKHLCLMSHAEATECASFTRPSVVFAGGGNAAAQYR